MIAVVIATLFAGAAFLAVNLSSSKGKALYDAMSSVAHSAETFNVDLGTYPTVYAAMFNPQFGQNADYNLAQINTSNTWDGPYAKAKTVGPGGNLHLNSIASGLVIGFQSVTVGDNGSLSNGLKHQYAVVAFNVPTHIAHSALTACNNTNKTGTGHGQCVLVQQSSQYDILYDVFSQSTTNQGMWEQTANQSTTQDGGNGLQLSQSGTSLNESITSGNGYGQSYSGGYNTSITYKPGSGFSGCLNISGSAMVGDACGGNAGICGSSNALVANPNTANSCGPGGSSGVSVDGKFYSNSADGSTGGPIRYNNGQFTGSPVVDNWLSSTGQPMQESFVPNGPCITEEVNGQATGDYCP